MKKRTTALMALALSVVMIAGCGSTSSTSTESASAGSSSSSATSSTAESSVSYSSASETAAASSSASSETVASTSGASGNVKYAEVEAPAGKVLRSLPVAQKSEKPIKIASICVQNNPWGAAVMVGQNFAKDVLADYNCTVDVISVSSFDAMAWTSAIENCISSGYDALCYMAVSDELETVTKQAVDAGIDVFLFNCDVPDSGRIAFYGMDDVQAGNVAGSTIVDALPDGGKYAIITGDFSVTGHENRRKGCHEITDKVSSLECVGEYENDDDADKAYSLTTDLLNSNPDLGAIYVTAGGPGGAAQALIDAGKQDDVTLVCHDVLDSVADYIADGVINVCIDQDPFNQGYQPIVDAYNYIVADVKPAQEINTYEAIVATPDNVKELFPELFNS